MSVGVRSRAAGLTLMETLVTLVIVSMVAGVLSQALFQFQRAERLMSTDRLQGQLTRLHRLWIRDAATALLSGTHGTAEEFVGTSTRWQGLSNAAPLPGVHGPTWVALELRSSSQGGHELVALAKGDPRGEAAHVLQRWDAGAARPEWRYLDHQGHWVEAWPVPSSVVGTAGSGLPPAIALVRGQDVLVMAAPPVNAMPVSSRIDVEKLP